MNWVASIGLAPKLLASVGPSESPPVVGGGGLSDWPSPELESELPPELVLSGSGSASSELPEVLVGGLLESRSPRS